MKKIALLILCITILMCLVACNQGNNQNPTPEHTHSFGEWSISKNATCTEDGIKVRYCDCGEKQSENIPLKGHTKVVLEATEATCTTEGKTEGEKCSDCGEILLAQEKIDALGHKEVVDPGTDATCTSTGLTEGKHCSVCNEITVKQEIIPALNHTEVIDAAVSATCTSTGLTEGKHCSVCNTVLVTQATTAKIAHTYTDKYDESCNECGFIRDAECAHINTAVIPAIDPTCTSTGLTEGSVCTRCEEILVAQGIVPTLPHTYGDWVTTKVANCGQDGEMTRYCTCGAKQTEVIYGTGMHSEVIDPAVAPTCTETGLTEGKHCSVCNEIILAQKIIPAFGHTAGAEADCLNAQICTVCKMGLAPANGHTEVIDEAVPATCTETGLTEGKHCSVCNEVLVEQEIVPAGHHYENNICTICKCIKYSEGLTYISYGDGTCYVSGIGTCTDTDIIIPETSPDGDSVTAIGGSAFYNCSNLTSVVIPDSVTTIYSFAFFNCNRLSSVVIGNNVTSIGLKAFDNCRNITSIAIPDSVTYIDSSAFYNCDSLSSVVIPDSVTTIGNEAFYSCGSLSFVVIGDSVTTIGYQAFSDCHSSLYTEHEFVKYVRSGDNPYAVVIGVTNKNMSTYPINEDTRIIADGAFFECSRLTSIEIPDSVTAIGNDAFWSCTNLSSVVIGDSVTTIGDDVFADCTNLSSVVIGDSVTTIGDDAFRNCDSLSSVVIGDSVTTIGDGAFRNCDSLSSVVIGDSVTTIGDAAFTLCESLTSIVIPDSVTTIGSSAFYSCDSLTDVYYTGSEAEWGEITIGDGNRYLIYATIHYNYVPDNN